MGIRNLKYLIGKYANGAVSDKYLCTYENKIIAIDISIYLYRFIYKNGEPIELLVKQIMRLLKNRVIPLYIFDGKPPKEKNDVLDERTERKNDLIKRQTQIKKTLEKKGYTVPIVEELPIIMEPPVVDEQLDTMSIEELKDELEKVEKKIIVINNKVIHECKDLFRLMGIPYIVAEGEAEALCAMLAKSGLVYGCLSEDTDILANGSRIFLRNFSVSNNKVVEYNLDHILHLMNITYEQFIDICILCGCDYTSTIKNIGVERAYKFIKQCGSIEGVLEHIKNEKKYIVPDNFDYHRARCLFIQMDENMINKCKDIIKLNMPQVDQLLNKYDAQLKKNSKMDVKRNLLKYHRSFNEFFE